jgi:hypothetical protein
MARVFSPYELENVSFNKAENGPPITTLADVASLLQTATRLEDEKFAEGGDDADGFELSSRPPSPLTELEDGDISGDEKDHPTAPGAVTDKERRKKAAKKRRSLRCIARARSGHAATSYTSDPSAHEKLEYSSAIELRMDVQELASSSKGSWVGKRSQGEKATPWTLEELEERDFTLIEWDGRSVSLIFGPAIFKSLH